MRSVSENLEILPAKNQLQLYGYEYYFNTFAKLFKSNNLPNTILLTGQKGSGKSTFLYHFINFLLSFNEEHKYSLDNFKINPDNKSYINLCNNTHPNFYLLENNESEENIKIENVRNLMKFLNKTTYINNIKIVLIDNVEYLNTHSSNALLKSLEDTNDRVFFFLVNSNSYKISDTIKSRCIDFKIFFTKTQKQMILENIVKQYKDNYNFDYIKERYYLDSPGNILKYLFILSDNNINLLENKSECIFFLIDEYKKKTNPQLLGFISLLVELFYNELSIKNTDKLNHYFLNKYKIVKQIDDSRKFNLDKKNLFIYLSGLLNNESK